MSYIYIIGDMGEWGQSKMHKCSYYKAIVWLLTIEELIKCTKNVENVL